MRLVVNTLAVQMVVVVMVARLGSAVVPVAVMVVVMTQIIAVKTDSFKKIYYSTVTDLARFLG